LIFRLLVRLLGIACAVVGVADVGAALDFDSDLVTDDGLGLS
jgi:hypothetical protein